MCLKKIKRGMNLLGKPPLRNGFLVLVCVTQLRILDQKGRMLVLEIRLTASIEYL